MASVEGDGWTRRAIGELPLYTADTIISAPNVAHGFTTRNGGVGRAPYDTLNMSLTCGDDPAAVAANRARAAAALGFPAERQWFAEQVHGDGIAVVRSAQSGGEPPPRADALITNVPGLLLTLQFADCFPIFIVDPVHQAVALIHSGWRGTALNIVRAATEAMGAEYGSNPAQCAVAVGPGIAGENYEVGQEVAAQFSAVSGSHAVAVAEEQPGNPGKYSLHVRRAIYAQLLECGYPETKISLCGADTYADETDFFSHRRETQRGRKTGRMAAMIGLQQE